MALRISTLVAALVAYSVDAITTNSQEYPQLQFPHFQDALSQPSLSPQQQSHILSDIQQHRFLVNQQNRQRPSGSFSPPQYQQSYHADAIPFQSFQQPVYQAEKKPILLQPTFAQQQRDYQAFQPNPFGNYQSQFQQPVYQNFENNFVQEKPRTGHQQFLTEVTQVKDSQYKPVTFAPEPVREETPSWILETQPPTPYKKQKPYEAITFATQAYQPATTAAPKAKPRPRPKPEESDESRELFIKPDRKKLYEQLVASAKPVFVTTPRPTSTPKPVRATTTQPPRNDEQFIQEQLQKQIQEQLSGKDDIFKTLKITLPGDLSPDQIANLPNIALGDSVAQLPEYALAPSPPTQSLYLANGQKLKVQPKGLKKNVKTVVVHQPTSTTVKPPTVLFEELTRNVLPPGADFEVIRQKQDGALEEVGPIQNLPQKKVTFVILEEQPDGSVKVQGVRGNENGPTETKGAEVDSIIERLKKGEIKLPPSTKLSKPSLANSTPQESQASPSYVKHVEKSSVKATPSPKRKSTTRSPVYSDATPVANSHAGPILPMEEFKKTTVNGHTRVYSTPTRGVTPSVSFLPTVSSEFPSVSPSSPSPSSTTFSPSPAYSLSTVAPDISPSLDPQFTHVPQYTASTASPSSLFPSPSPTPTPFPTLPESHSPDSIVNAARVLTDTLKTNNLYAMSRFLRQSGLDMVLNDTGPYTIFVPTDRAFRSLLVQLGGPDRAEIKFKENPRLLSGLLLHHVIPGTFKIDQLLDEMTGVSLAGTQLRVNTYTTQDHEWNDVKVVTINGAKVLQDKSDISVPQGIAHTVDRVMFPLPVGDVVQTLQSDRENRFSKFIKLLQETGVDAMLQGTKTYTVFAPTDAAFADADIDKILEQRATARSLALRHVTPGTLYSAGMLYYQLRESMNSANQIQLSKEAGKVKVNNAHVISRNIPATNGVIHAVDTLL